VCADSAEEEALADGVGDDYEGIGNFAEDDDEC